MTQRTGVSLQPRDLSLFRGLYESRVMTIRQIAALYFAGALEMARKRVARLVAGGYLATRRKSLPTLPSGFTLAEAGFGALVENKCLEGLPLMNWSKLQKRLEVKDATLVHELDVLDAKVALVNALASHPTYQVSECSTWPALHQFESTDSNGASVMVYPDAFLRIEKSEAGAVFESVYYIEIDRSTESLDVLVARCAAYREHYRLGGYAVACGHDRAAYHDFFFRVLITCVSSERRNNIAVRLLMLPQPILSQVWITTQAELLRNPLGAIWVRPKDIDAAQCSDTDVSGESRRFDLYRRSGDRERALEERLVKHPLIADATQI